MSHIWSITCFRGSPNNRGILAILRIGRAQSLNAPLLPVAIYLSYENTFLTRSTTRRNGDNKTRTRHQQDDRDKRKRRDGKVHHNETTSPHQPPTHPPNQQRRATHDMTRHHNTHMYMYMYMCVYVHVGVHVHVGVSQACDLPQCLNVPFLIQVQT